MPVLTKQDILSKIINRHSLPGNTPACLIHEVVEKSLSKSFNIISVMDNRADYCLKTRKRRGFLENVLAQAEKFNEKMFRLTVLERSVGGKFVAGRVRQHEAAQRRQSSVRYSTSEIIESQKTRHSRQFELDFYREESSYLEIFLCFFACN